mgnify:CR=1 FL=1
MKKKSKLSITARVLLLAFLVVLTTYATLYTIAAYDLARWGWTCRGSLGDATFFPFPTGPRGVLMDVIAKMSSMDEFIYLYLMKTGILIVVCILLWILVAVHFFGLFLAMAREKSSIKRIG